MNFDQKIEDDGLMYIFKNSKKKLEIQRTKYKNIRENEAKNKKKELFSDKMKKRQSRIDISKKLND